MMDLLIVMLVAFMMVSVILRVVIDALLMMVIDAFKWGIMKLQKIM